MATKGVNKITLLGKLGNDPEVRFTPNGKAVCNLSVATSETWKDQQGQTQEITDWHRVVIWGKRGEIVGQFLAKGDPIYIEGKSRTREYTDQQNVKRYVTEVIVDQTGDMQMVGNKNRPNQSV